MGWGSGDWGGHLFDPPDYGDILTSPGQAWENVELTRDPGGNTAEILANTDLFKESPLGPMAEEGLDLRDKAAGWYRDILDYFKGSDLGDYGGLGGGTDWPYGDGEGGGGGGGRGRGSDNEGGSGKTGGLSAEDLAKRLGQYSTQF